MDPYDYDGYDYFDDDFYDYDMITRSAVRRTLSGEDTVRLRHIIFFRGSVDRGIRLGRIYI